MVESRYSLRTTEDGQVELIDPVGATIAKVTGETDKVLAELNRVADKGRSNDAGEIAKQQVMEGHRALDELGVERVIASQTCSISGRISSLGRRLKRE